MIAFASFAHWNYTNMEMKVNSEAIIRSLERILPFLCGVERLIDQRMKGVLCETCQVMHFAKCAWKECG